MIERANDKLLFTPGPLTTSFRVKQEMLHDAGSWHYEFTSVVTSIRRQLLAITCLPIDYEYECILLQGSGTYGVESVIGSVVPPQGKLLIITNGAYGERIVQMAQALRINHQVLRCEETERPQTDKLDDMLSHDSSISHIAMVHCETTTGILNPLETIGQIIARHRRVFIVDAMSSFGAIPINFQVASIDFLISSANKCLEGVPGFSFVIARKNRLLESEGCARSLSLNLHAQWRGFEKNGQFRFTPPTHSLLAFARALQEHQDEGGVNSRATRYSDNHHILIDGMRPLGILPLLPDNLQSYIITAFRYPENKAFHFDAFYTSLSDEGMIIYPGKLTKINTFRIGTIGRIFPSDIRALLHSIRNVLIRMECPIPSK